MNGRFAVLALVFTLTGGTALLAEQAFEKLLATLVGASTSASAVVLATYFAGLSLGGLLYGARRRRPLLLYAIFEAIVAAACLALDLAFDHLAEPFIPLLQWASGSPLSLSAARGFIACVWILPITIPMGATFPAVVDAVSDWPPAKWNRVSLLYAANLVGALSGAILGPALVFPSLGLDGALRTVAVLDGTAAIAALLLLRATGNTTSAIAASAPTRGPNAPSALVFIAFLSGLLFFACEVVWTHLIAAVLGNSVYAFAAMLASVLLALGLASIFSALVVGARPAIPWWVPAAALAASGLAVFFTAGQWPSVPHEFAQAARGSRSFLQSETQRWLMAARAVVPVALPLGLVYPFLFRLGRFPSSRPGRAAGQLLAANALGSVLGALASVFLLLPKLGSEQALVVLACSCLVGSAIALLTLGPKKARSLALLVGVAGLALASFRPNWDRLALTSGEHVYFRRGHVWEQSKLLMFHEDAVGITTVVETLGIRVLLSNGKFQGDDHGEMDAQTGFALLPMQYASRFDRALVLGLGTARSAYVTAVMGFDRVDIAEIAPGIVLAARDFFGHVNGNVLDRPGVRLFMEDGRNLMLFQPDRYDFITMEISSIWFAGASSLYSEEFYRLAKARLQPDGVFQQWIQFHHIAAEDLFTSIASLRSVFPFVSVHFFGGQGILVATQNPQVVKASFAERVRAAHQEVFPAKTEIDERFRAIAEARLLAPSDVDELLAHVHPVLNTDRNRRLEYTTPRYNHRTADMAKMNVTKLVEWAKFPPILCEDGARATAPALCEVTAEAYSRALGVGPP